MTYNKVQMSRKHHVNHSSAKLQMYTKYKFLKVQMSRDHHVACKVQVHSQIPQSTNSTQATHGHPRSSKVQTPPAKYKFLKVRMTRDSIKVQIRPAKYKFLKVQMSRDRHVNNNSAKVHSQTPQSTNIMQPTRARHTKEQMESANTRNWQFKNQGIATFSYKTNTKNSFTQRNSQAEWARQTPKHTPYGPHNLPHMVLNKKQGPEHA